MEKQYTLPKAFAEKWVSALRSGEYKQGKGSLRYDDKYCCLGVACVIIEPTMDIEDTSFIYSKYDVESKNGYEGIDLDKNTMLNSIPKEIYGDDEHNELVRDVSYKNDNGFTFSQIADWIEANVQFI